MSKPLKAEEGELIYRYVEFAGGGYYQAEALVDGEGIRERIRARMKMKVYFKTKWNSSFNCVWVIK